MYLSIELHEFSSALPCKGEEGVAYKAMLPICALETPLVPALVTHEKRSNPDSDGEDFYA